MIGAALSCKCICKKLDGHLLYLHNGVIVHSTCHWTHKGLSSRSTEQDCLGLTRYWLHSLDHFFVVLEFFCWRVSIQTFVTLRLLFVIVTVYLLVCLVFLPKWNQSRLLCTIQKYFGDESMSKFQKMICFFSLRKVIPFLRLRSGLSSHVTENCKWRAWLSR